MVGSFSLGVLALILGPRAFVMAEEQVLDADLHLNSAFEANGSATWAQEVKGSAACPCITMDSPLYAKYAKNPLWEGAGFPRGVWTASLPRV